MLKGHLFVLHSNGLDAANLLVSAASEDDLDDARDPAAVIDHRLDILDLRDSGTQRPLAWLPGVPKLLADHPVWAGYLAQRAALIETLRYDLRAQVLVDDQLPAWAAALAQPPDRQAIADIEIWRAAHQLPDTDLRPTGPGRTHLAEARIQHRLDGELAAEPVEVLNWVDRIHAAFPDTAGDPSVLRTARACAKADPDGEWLPEYLQVEAQHPLPDEHKADALRSRLDIWLRPAPAEYIEPTRSLRITDPHRNQPSPLPGKHPTPGIGR